MAENKVWDQVRKKLEAESKRWLVTGAAGFIGSHLTETLLKLGQKVRGIDNFATGYRSNLEDVANKVGAESWQNFEFIEGDISRLTDCQKAVKQVDYVLHQAALGSVPRSIGDPLASNRANVEGFLNMSVAARDGGIKRMVYASSSSVYGDSAELPKREDSVGMPLSPYAATKRANELYASAFNRVYGLNMIGLRYFNVFGPRQDPDGAYAAVIPRWIKALLRSEQCVIFGNGETSRDFCYVANVVQANLLAALSNKPAAGNEFFNIALSQRTTLKDLYRYICEAIFKEGAEMPRARFEPQRPGDVAHSLADISRAQGQLGYEPIYDLRAGLCETIDWFILTCRAK